MTPDLQKIYSNCVLKKDWRGAVQILKVALDRESGDSEAMRQLSDMRGLFYIEAGALIREAEICVSGGNQNDSLQIIKRLDERFPEWVELSDSNDVLTALWNVKFAKPVAASAIPSDPKVEDPEQVLPSMEIRAEKSLKELLERAEPTMLTSVKIADLRQLETLFVEADHGFVLGVKSGTVTKKQITDGLARVRAQIEENGNRSVVRNFMVLLGLLILTGIGVWLLKARKEPDLTVPTPVPIPSPKGKLNKELWNPHELNDDFLLPMPENGQMVFRRIALPRSKIEGEQSSFFEFIVTSEGSEKRRVYAPFEESQERYYFLGKYEVTEGQYDAIMSPSSLRANAMPKRNVTFEEANSFCERYTKWIQKQNRDILPTSPKRKTVAIIRLPDSAEWEFAARGGRLTYGNAEFSQRFPYPATDLNRYEWFGGDGSSNYEVHPIGKKMPNVLGCYDLLGNVREITCTPLQRGGAYRQAVVARGGDVRTKERDMNVGLVTEHPLASRNGVPFETEMHGFRVLLGILEPDPEFLTSPKGPPSPDGGVSKQQ